MLRRTVFSLFLILLPVVEASAQERAGFSLLFTGGYQLGSARVDFTGMPEYRSFSDGETSGFSFGVGVGKLKLSLVTDTPFLRDLVALPLLTYKSTSAAFLHEMPDALILLPGQTIPTTQKIEEQLAFAMQDFGLDLQILYNVWEGFGFKLGMQSDYRRIVTWKLTQNLIEPPEARFVNSEGYPTEDAGRVIVLSNGSDIERSHLSASSTLSILYELPLAEERITIVPEIGVSSTFSYSSLVQGGRGSMFSYGGSLSIRYNFGSDEPVPTPLLPPTGALPPVDSSAPPLTASIDLFTLDGDKRLQTLRLVTTRNRRSQETLLLPVVAFEPGDRTLPNIYRKFDRAQAKSFSLDSIARLDDALIQSHLLNIIGSRLQKFSGEKLRLVVSRSADDRARAGSVRSYLKDVWQIAPSRLMIETTGTTAESVRLIASQRVLAPLTAEWIEQAVVASPLQIDPRISGGVAPRSWTLTLRRGDELVAQRSSEDAGAIDLELSFGAPSAGEMAAPLTAELSVRDSGGGVAVARDTMEVVVVGED